MCAQMIDNVPYPSNWAELKKDAALMKVFKVYSKGYLIEENFVFLTSKRIPNRDYVMFVHDNATSQINISSAVKSKMDTLVANSPRDQQNRPIVDWAAPAWKTHLKSAENEVIWLVEMDHLTAGQKFWKSKIFLEYHAKFSTKGAKRTGTNATISTVKVAKLPWKTLQFLGWENPKDVSLHKALSGMIAAVQQKDARGAKAFHRQATNTQSNKSLVAEETFEATIKAFKKKGLIKK